MSSHSKLSKLLFFFSFFTAIGSVSAFVSIEQPPIATAYTPNSILSNPPPGNIYYAGDRPRYSTCSGVAWFGNYGHLAAVNKISSSIQIYKFNEISCSLELIKKFHNSSCLNLSGPENLAFSNNRQLLAIPNVGNGDVNVYKYDSNSSFLNLPFERLATIKGNKAHGATFSPTGEYLSVCFINHNYQRGEICTYRIISQRNKNIKISRTQNLRNPMYPLKPKSIAFSSDSKFVVIGYSMQLKYKEGEKKAVLASYKFDAKRGIIDPTPISYIDNLFSIETLLFTSDCSTILTTDQVNDTIIAHEFDPNTGELGEGYIVLENPDAQLSLPHGIALSSDDKFLAVSNYGEDKVTIYAVTIK
ncbi:MAG: hypothetical protein K1060chlam2_00034 [Chlamydiae bacterium]|nr:hypothetical protein [Chlamydiota bacterium]